MQRHERFSGDFHFRLQSLLQALCPHIVQKHKERPAETREANFCVAHFIKVCWAWISCLSSFVFSFNFRVLGFPFSFVIFSVPSPFFIESSPCIFACRDQCNRIIGDWSQQFLPGLLQACSIFSSFYNVFIIFIRGLLVL